MEINTAIAERARGGAVLTDAELAELDAVDVLSLGMLADEVRRARVGDAVTYTRVLEIGIPAAGDTREPERDAADEVRLTRLPGSLEETLELIGTVRARRGARRLTGFSLSEVMARSWGEPSRVLAALKEAGLDAIAEAPVDVVEAADVGLTAAAGLGPATLSVQRWSEDRVALLARARAIVAWQPLLRRFAPLAREQSVATPTTGYHDVRQVALARLALPGIPQIEVDWQQYGPKLAQVALIFGANHLDRVSPFDDPALGPRRATVEEVRRNIAAAGFRPANPGEAA
jgi:aminodeoxyfutalosine synthase